MTNPETPSAAPVAWCRSGEFAQFAQGREYLLAFSEQHPDCDMALYAHPQASATPDADQPEGPSLDDVAELCAEFGFDLLDDNFGESLDVLRDMITAAITRWRAPVAEPVAPPSIEISDEAVAGVSALVLRLARSANHSALPAQGEVKELVEFLDGVADVMPHLCHADKVRRSTEVLKMFNPVRVLRLR